MDPDISALFQVLVDGQSQTDKSVRALTAMLASRVQSSATRFDRLEAAHLRTEHSIADLAANVDRHVAAADARMTRIEENLDGLIRAISREHSSGQGHD